MISIEIPRSIQFPVKFIDVDDSMASASHFSRWLIHVFMPSVFKPLSVCCITECEGLWRYACVVKSWYRVFKYYEALKLMNILICECGARVMLIDCIYNNLYDWILMWEYSAYMWMMFGTRKHFRGNKLCGALKFAYDVTNDKQHPRNVSAQRIYSPQSRNGSTFFFFFL